MGNTVNELFYADQRITLVVNLLKKFFCSIDTKLNRFNKKNKF